MVSTNVVPMQCRPLQFYPYLVGLRGIGMAILIIFNIYKTINIWKFNILELLGRYRDLIVAHKPTNTPTYNNTSCAQIRSAIPEIIMSCLKRNKIRAINNRLVIKSKNMSLAASRNCTGQMMIHWLSGSHSKKKNANMILLKHRSLIKTEFNMKPINAHLHTCHCH